MNEELVDVAVGRIVQPDNRLFHGNPMPTNVYRIQLVRVLDGYDELLPPYRPPGADDEDVMNLRDCLSWNMLWPKCQIRLGAGDSTPRTTPPVVPTPSHGKTAPTPSADPGHHPTDMDVAQDRSNTDTLLGRVDEYFNEHGGCEMVELFGPASQEPNLGAKDSHRSSGSAEMNCNNKRRLQLFSSQETPPAAAFTEAETAEARNVISPNTLRNAISEQVKVLLGEKPKKKGRTRKKKGPTTASQPAPTIRAQDGPPVPDGIMSTVHVAGKRMLSHAMFDAASGAIQSLHDSVLTIETRRLREKDVAYPVFVAKVPEGKGFVDCNIGRLIFLRFDDIFAMLHLFPLHYTFVRLFALSMQMRIIRDKTPDIVVVDPFYMRAKLLCSPGDRRLASDYLEGVIMANKDKDNFLVPYFLE